ncbi:MAG: glycosyltransferase family 39 protein [Methanobrevibacter sp.]|jgi:hypothetical protein|nr:glycosyltransferase family 39 protein [Candidatus Methanovirga procula]
MVLNMKTVSKISDERNLSKLIFIISFFLFFAFLWMDIGDNYLRYDEMFSLHLARDSISNIISLTAMDVHPPLHYFWLKLVVSICQFLDLPGGEIFFGKISSAIPILLLMIFSFKCLKKDIGNLGASLFCFSLVAMPNMVYYMEDVRMYSLGMLFVTLTYYMLYKIQNNGSLKEYALLIFFTICGIFTQYYCTVALFSGYFILFFWLSLKNDISKIKYLISSGLISAGIFIISWGLILVNQVKYVSNSFWIGSFDADTALHTIFYMLGNWKVGDTTYTLINSPISWEAVIFIILITFCISMVLYYLFNKNKSLTVLKNRFLSLNFLLFGSFIIVLEVVSGCVLSELIGKSTLHVRYLVIGIPLLWLSVCLVISKTYKMNDKAWFYALFALFLLGGSLSIYYNIEQIKTNHISSHHRINDFNLISDDDLVIDADLTTTAWRELIKPHPDNNTLVDKLDVYWEPPFFRVYSSQHDMSILRGNIISRVEDTLDNDHKVWINGERAVLYTIRDDSFGFDDYHVVLHEWCIEITK